MLFTYDRVSLCVLMIVGFEPTAFCLIDRRSTNELYRTYCDVLTQLLHTLLEYTIQHTTYLLSCELLSRLLRSVLTPPFDSLHQPLKLHTSPWVQPLGPIHYPFSYQLTGLVLL
jgi:hypothetical protein